MIDQDAGAKHVSRRSIHAVANIIGLGIESIKVERSQSYYGKHWVVVVDRDLGPLEVVAIQACMGDDLKRCALNLARVMGGRPGDWNILYDRKIHPNNGGRISAPKNQSR